MAMTIYVAPMAENNPSGNSTCKKERQQISIPFIWEERPGIPIKDWKPKPVAMATTSGAFTFTPPVKLIASVPFEWEEKPGTPLPFFSQTSPHENIVGLPSTVRVVHEGRDDFWAGIGEYIDQHGSHEEDEMSESEVEASDSESIYESFSSAPSSLLANGFIPTVDISSAVPVEQTSPTADIHHSQLQTPLSPTSEAGSSVLSYATGTTSLVGTAFLEKLFPLLSPNTSFLQNCSNPEKGHSHVPPKALNNNQVRENNCSIKVRHPLTLGELIMMSRRRSYQRKTVQMQKQTISKHWRTAQQVEEAIATQTNLKDAHLDSQFGTTLKGLTVSSPKKVISVIRS
ncbi:hypothetical protein MTR67_013720 [Solanum verrucosum]|uniref:Hydroxyproline-rich glycoprotein family protein n=1 Tax=Solanum verrucosum TaxID=315347 RepID=A0AAF0TP26_SOLVR|nr:hypothetical protein MTR67_013720 [Solanum verrucosum]